MTTLRVLAVVLAASLLACVPPPPPPAPAAPSAPAGESPDQMIAAAKALDQEFLAAFNRGDLEGVVATYWKSPDVVVFPPDSMEARGPDAIRASFVQSLATMAGGTLELTEAHYSVAGDAVTAWGRWRFTMPASGAAAPAEMLGRFTQVSAKRDGRWVYLVDHASVPLPPPPAPAGASGK